MILLPFALSFLRFQVADLSTTNLSNLSRISYVVVARNFPTHTRLGATMHEAGLTSSRVAALSGVHYRTLTEYLAGRVHPLPDHAAMLSDALGVAPEDLFPESDYPKSDYPKAASA